MVVGPGVGPLVSVAVPTLPCAATSAPGATPFAVAWPPFVTVIETVKELPAGTLAGRRNAVTVRAGGVCTVAEPDTGPVDTPAPLFASVPLAEVAREKEPAVADEQLV
jgi:hypothetical protein